jgi:hypothetical protein
MKILAKPFLASSMLNVAAVGLFLPGGVSAFVAWVANQAT